MNFAALPPEVNSNLMYAGAGPGPMLTAAAAWDGLAAELHSAAASYESLISELTSGSWVGPSSAAMAAAVSPYLVWMNTTAVQAEKTATQVKAAVAAYEAAFAMTVPPTVVAANRTLLTTLVATNIFGQNSPAIAANEAQYGEMWAQDATAMYGYVAASPTAAEVEPFAPPPQANNPAGQLGQAATVGQALGNSAGNNAQTLPSQLTAMLQGLASPTQGTSLPAIPSLQAVPLEPFDLLGIIADELGVGVALPLSVVGVWLAGAAMYYAELDSREIIEAQDMLAGGQSTILDALEEGFGPGSVNSASLSSGRIPVSAGIGQAVSAGNLSVPPSWATAAPEIRTTAYASPDTSAAATPGGLGTAFSQMAMAGMAGSALAGAVRPGGQGSASPGAAERRAAPAQAAGASSQGPPEPLPPPPALSVPEMAAGIRELGQLRDSGLITEAEFTEQKRRLLSR